MISYQDALFQASCAAMSALQNRIDCGDEERTSNYVAELSVKQAKELLKQLGIEENSKSESCQHEYVRYGDWAMNKHVPAKEGESRICKKCNATIFEGKMTADCPKPYMIYSLKDLLSRAEKSGATLESAGVSFDARLRCRWIAWILNKIYGKKALEIWVEVGRAEDDKLILGGSTWTWKG